MIKLLCSMLIVAGCTPASISATTTAELIEQPAQVTQPAQRLPAQQITTPPTTVYVPFEGAQCGEWHIHALNAGWDESHLERLDHIMWRESRCQPQVHNTSDPQGGSRGLTQINGFWCRPNRYESNRAGYLGARSIITSCDDLFDPEMNLRSAKAIYDYGVERGQCPWRPWSTRNTKWCG